MRLKTHDAYSEAHIDDNTGAWSVRVYDVYGKVLEQSSGKADSADMARASVSSFVASVEAKYRKNQEVK